MTAPIPSPGEGSARAPADLPVLSAEQASALLRSALAITCELFERSLPLLLEQTRDTLSQRWEFDAAVAPVQRLLNTKVAVVREGFVRSLAAAQDAALARLLATPAADADADAEDLHASLLQLVTEGADPGADIAARAARRLRGAVEEPLRDVELIVRFLSARPSLALADNPLGPEVLAFALLAAVQGADLESDAWAFFLTAVEPDISAEFGRVLQSLLDHFRAHGLTPRSVRRALAVRRPAAAPAPTARVGTPPTGADGEAAGVDLPLAVPGVASGIGRSVRLPQSGAPAAARPAAAEAAAAPGAGGGEQQADARLILGDLLARLQSNEAGAPLAPLPAGEGAVAPSLLDALRELQNLGLEGIHGALFAGTPAGSINAWREHLISRSTRTVEKLTIEIVGMLFDHVLRDAQVPAEIKALLSRLQFPILKAALLDAAFFASSAHPARRLIDRIAATAVGWEPYGDENRRFREEVERLVNEVLKEFESDLAIFERMLNEFEAFVGDVTPRAADPIARAKQALEEAEKREVLTINTTIQVRRAFERIELEPWLREFLLGPWVQVLVHASLRDSQTAGYSKSFREAIHEIVWSVQPKASAAERRRLVELIPVLTRILRDGLELIGLPERAQEEFFQELMAAHAFAVKPTDQATHIRHALQSSEVRARVESLELTSSFPLTSIPGGVKVPTRALLRAAAAHDIDLAVPEAPTDLEGERDDKEGDARSDKAVAAWTRGSWFELWWEGAFIKVQLRWISPLRTMFLFSSDGSKAHVLSRELVRAYLRRDYVRPLEKAPLTERAAQALVADFTAVPTRADTLARRLTVPG